MLITMEVDEIRMAPEPMDIDDHDVHDDAVTDCVSAAPLGSRRRRPGPDANVRGAQQLMPLPDLLLRRDAAEYFISACESMVVKWMSLETTTALLEGTTSSDPRIILAFKTLDRLFDSESDIYIIRMAYIQLGRLIRRLEIMIKSERQAGILHREHRYRDSSISIDMYMSAKEPVKDIVQVRKQLIERRVISMRWGILVGSTPFLSLIFSETAEKIMYVRLSPT